MIVFLLFGGIALLIFFGGLIGFFVKMFRKVEQGKALVVSKTKSVEVTFVGMPVLPIIHKAEIMDISVKTIEIDRRGQDGLICQDNIRADIKVIFFVRVNKTKEDVIKVAQAIGCARASDRDTLDELFNAKFSEALKTVGKQLEFIDLYTQREEFRDRIVAVIGTDLNGYVLEDAAIDYLEQTPIEALDPQNILDAQGIRKITMLTAEQHVFTNLHQNEERKNITRQNVEAQETIFELERQQADAQARQLREIASVQAREQAETLRVQAEEKLKAERARITTDEQLGIQNENAAREIAVAEKNKERVIAIEIERVEKDRQLEVVGRERETSLATISKDKEVEAGKKDVADVVRERVAVDRTVAEQEEMINTLRVVEEAERQRQAEVIAAEAVAQAEVVKEVQRAKAAEDAANHKAKERLTLSQANLEASDLDAKADIRLAEGTKATDAAPGLAAAEVKERDADATEKFGRAEAAAIEAKITGEARGLTEKAAAMAKLDTATRKHEEYRMRIDAMKEIQITEISARREIAERQAELIGQGLQGADIDIVGGDSIFFDRLVGAIAYGKGVDAFIENSEVVSGLVAEALSGEGEVLDKVKELASQLDLEDVKNLTVSALLLRLLTSGGGGPSGELGQLLEKAREFGVADVPVAELTAPAK